MSENRKKGRREMRWEQKAGGGYNWDRKSQNKGEYSEENERRNRGRNNQRTVSTITTAGPAVWGQLFLGVSQKEQAKTNATTKVKTKQRKKKRNMKKQQRMSKKRGKAGFSGQAVAVGTYN